MLTLREIRGCSHAPENDGNVRFERVIRRGLGIADAKSMIDHYKNKHGGV